MSFAELKARAEANPGDADLAIEAARLAHLEGKAHEAIPLLHRAARSLMDEDPEKAINVFVTLKSLGQPDAETHSSLALLYRQTGRLQEAEQEVRLLLRRDFNDTDALRMLGEIALEKGVPKDAVLAANKLLQIDPRNPEARELLGNAYLASEQPDEAVKAYLMAALNFVSLQEKDEAVRIYRRVLEIDPNNMVAFRELGNLGA